MCEACDIHIVKKKGIQSLLRKETWEENMKVSV